MRDSCVTACRIYTVCVDLDHVSRNHTYEKFRKVRIDPGVIDQACTNLGLGDDKLGAKLRRSQTTIRQWRKGDTVPTASDLVRLQFLTGRPYSTMLICEDGGDDTDQVA